MAALHSHLAFVSKLKTPYNEHDLQTLEISLKQPLR